MTLYFFEQITDDDFIGPVVIAAASEMEAWELLGRREGAAPTALKEAAWDISQELKAIPGQPAIVYPGHYRQAILSDSAAQGDTTLHVLSVHRRPKTTSE